MSSKSDYIWGENVFSNQTNSKFLLNFLKTCKNLSWISGNISGNWVVQWLLYKCSSLSVHLEFSYKSKNYSETCSLQKIYRTVVLKAMLLMLKKVQPRLSTKFYWQYQTLGSWASFVTFVSHFFPKAIQVKAFLKQPMKKTWQLFIKTKPKHDFIAQCKCSIISQSPVKSCCNNFSYFSQ